VGQMSTQSVWECESGDVWTWVVLMWALVMRWVVLTRYQHCSVGWGCIGKLGSKAAWSSAAGYERAYPQGAHRSVSNDVVSTGNNPNVEILMLIEERREMCSTSTYLKPLILT